MKLESFHPRDRIAMLMSRIYGHRLTTTFGGNVSVLDESGDIWITPARVDKGSLTPRDIVRVRADGTVDGRYAPSSEYPLHRAIYDARPDLGCVLHAHPTSLVAFALAGRAPDSRLLAETWRRNGVVQVSPWAESGSDEQRESVAGKFGDGAWSVVMARHGMVCAGKTADDAFARFDTLEFAARAELRARLLGDPIPLSPAELAHERVRAAAAIAPLRRIPHTESLQEIEAREVICEFMERGLRHRLFMPSVGTVSARISPDAFLITPHPCDRPSLRPSDLVLVREGKAEEGRAPSRMTHLHEAIYLSHPGVGAVINASPLNTLAFSMCRRRIDIAALPELRRPLPEVPMVPFDTLYLHPEKAVAGLDDEHPAFTICNNGAVVAGRDLFEAYDRLESLENAADALIGSIALAHGFNEGALR
ncbi:MAG: class II aldolase/adducin family protein [Kiritimatiellae bacterium]|nr:class II aldolase/adducin family protein [Kiritimatiellia bacterium]